MARLFQTDLHWPMTGTSSCDACSWNARRTAQGLTALHPDCKGLGNVTSMVRTWSLRATSSFWKIPQNPAPTLHLRGGNVNLPPDHLTTAWNRPAESPLPDAFLQDPVGTILNKLGPNKENVVRYPEKCLVDSLIYCLFWSCSTGPIWAIWLGRKK